MAIAMYERLWFARAVRPGPEDTSGSLENHEPAVRTPHGIRVLKAVGQAGLGASQQVVDPQVCARALTRHQRQAVAVGR